MRGFITMFPDGVPSEILNPLIALFERVIGGYSGKDLSGLVFYKHVLEAMHTQSLLEIVSDLERQEIVGRSFYDDSSILITDLDFLKRLLKGES
jgi:hypothetical protein